MVLHPTQFREVYARLKHMSEAGWEVNDHLVVKGPERVTVTYNPLQEFRGVVDLEAQARVLASVWGVPLDSIFRDGASLSTICDMTGKRLSVPDQRVVFPAAFAQTGLWPANKIDLTHEINNLPRV